MVSAILARRCGSNHVKVRHSDRRHLVQRVKQLALRLVVLVGPQQKLAYPLDGERRPAVREVYFVIRVSSPAYLTRFSATCDVSASLDHPLKPAEPRSNDPVSRKKIRSRRAAPGQSAVAPQSVLGAGEALYRSPLLISASVHVGAGRRPEPLSRAAAGLCARRGSGRTLRSSAGGCRGGYSSRRSFRPQRAPPPPPA